MGSLTPQEPLSKIYLPPEGNPQLYPLHFLATYEQWIVIATVTGSQQGKQPSAIFPVFCQTRSEHLITMPPTEERSTVAFKVHQKTAF